MDDTFTKILLDVKHEVTLLGSAVSNQKDKDISMHQAILDKLENMEDLMNEKMKYQERRIFNLESNQSKLVWIVISAVVMAVMGVVLISPQL